MNTSKHLSSVALFPLCDARSVLMDALRDSSQAPTTRGDALVFAWRLGLPESMNVGHAANAVLLAAMSIRRESWSRGQLLIIRELMVLAGREEPLPTDDAKKPVSKVVSKSIRQRRKPSVSRDAVEVSSKSKESQQDLAKVAKQDKDWWKLVGRSETKNTPARGQRRTERSLRET